MQHLTITPPTTMEQENASNNAKLAEKWQSESGTESIERVRPVLTVKRCSCCGEVKPLSEFYAAVSNKDGLQTFCKACNVKKQKTRRENRKSEAKEEKLRTELSQFEPRELIAHLRSLGYKGTLHFTKTYDIEL